MPPPADDPVEIVITEITAPQLKALLDSDLPPLVLDVRETYELPTQGVIPGSMHMPMNTAPRHLAELPRDRLIVIQCSHGYRSFDVAGYLLDQGFPQAQRPAGGIEAWNRLPRPSR